MAWVHRRFSFSWLSAAALLSVLWCVLGNAQWQPDQRITNNPDSSFTMLNNGWTVAASGDTIHIVWNDRRDGNWEVYYNRSVNGGVSWGSDLRFTNNGAMDYSPTIAVSGLNVHVGWRRDGIYYRRSTNAGTSWSAETRLNTAQSSYKYPTTATWATGQYVYLAWEDNRDGNEEVYCKGSWDNGVNWGPDVNLTNSPDTSVSPTAGVSGSIIVGVCADHRGGDWNIGFVRSTDYGLTWIPGGPLTTDPRSQVQPSAAMSGAYAHVVWQDDRNGSNWEIYYKRSTDGGVTWGSDTRFVYGSSNGGSEWPWVSSSGSLVHVTWHDHRFGSTEIYYKRSTNNGATWEAETRLTNSSGTSMASSVNASGQKVHVLWEDERDGNMEIYYKRNPTGNTIGIEEELGGQMHGTRLIARPNPFVQFTSIKGRETERFAVYDVSGKKVGVNSGDRIGAGLAPGVYFVQSQKGLPTHQRIVKIE